jgi:hypothetical protein
MLDHSEQRRLREIERMLETDDPAFAQRLTSTSTQRDPTGPQHRMKVLMIIGGSLALAGLLVHPLVVAVGLSIALTAFWIRVGTAWIERSNARDNEDDSTDDSGGEVVPT